MDLFTLAMIKGMQNNNSSGGTGDSGGTAVASEWKRLTRIEVAEDEVQNFHITTDENGAAFSATDFIFRIKAIQRASVSSFKVGAPWYNSEGAFHLGNSININCFAMMNAFGNTSGDRYYTIQVTHDGDWRRLFLSESNADIFSKTSNVYAAANNVYGSGVTYTVGNIAFPIDGLVIFATNNFFIGDIIEVWYK